MLNAIDEMKRILLIHAILLDHEMNHALIIVKFLVPRRATAQSIAADSLIHFFITTVLALRH